MSYSYQVKKALCEQKKNLCCKKSELYGFLVACNTFSDELIKIYTENLDILDYYLKIINKLTGEDLVSVDDVEIKGKKSLKYILTIEKSKTSLIMDKLNSEMDILMENDCCKQSFIRGFFISCGFVSDPKKMYQAEFVIRSQELVDKVIRICEDLELSLKKSKRKNEYIVYVKNAEGVKDLLILMGASEFAFDYMNAEIEKELKNSINRISNCDMANIDKAIQAAERQVQAIRKFEAINYEGLTPELISVAILRLNNMECSLDELSKMTDPPMSKSGVSHRLRKIIELAERI